MSLFLVRHFPTKWNQEGMLQGVRDIPILEPNASDRRAMQENQKQLSRVRVEKVVCSEMKRARQTAMLYGYVDCEVDSRLNELDFGDFEGKPKSDLVEWKNGQWLWNPTELILGESMRNFEAKLKEFVRDNQGCGNVLAFTHGAVIRGIRSIVLCGGIKNMNSYEIKNNSMMVL